MIQTWKIKHGLFVGANGRGDNALSPETKKIYRAWRAIKTRCFDKNSRSYKDYGARGITMCEQWQDNFLMFFRDVGLPPSNAYSIGRIDNDGSYEPSNCHWETPREQQANRRCTVRITIAGETRCMAEWARLAGISAEAFAARVKVGRKGVDLLRPKRQGGRKKQWQNSASAS